MVGLLNLKLVNFCILKNGRVDGALNCFQSDVRLNHCGTTAAKLGVGGVGLLQGLLPLISIYSGSHFFDFEREFSVYPLSSILYPHFTVTYKGIVTRQTFFLCRTLTLCH